MWGEILSSWLFSSNTRSTQGGGHRGNRFLHCLFICAWWWWIIGDDIEEYSSFGISKLVLFGVQYKNWYHICIPKSSPPPRSNLYLNINLCPIKSKVVFFLTGQFLVDIYKSVRIWCFSSFCKLGNNLNHEMSCVPSKSKSNVRNLLHRILWTKLE